MWSDGRLYHGMWKEGFQHGEGTLIEASGNKTKKYYERGKAQHEL